MNMRNPFNRLNLAELQLQAMQAVREVLASFYGSFDMTEELEQYGNLQGDEQRYMGNGVTEFMGQPGPNDGTGQV